MNSFHLSLAIIVAGGVLPLLTYRQLVLTKCIYIGVTTTWLYLGTVCDLFRPG